jgi:hypothetical protein
MANGDYEGAKAVYRSMSSGDRSKVGLDARMFTNDAGNMAMGSVAPGGMDQNVLTSIMRTLIPGARDAAVGSARMASDPNVLRSLGLNIDDMASGARSAAAPVANAAQSGGRNILGALGNFFGNNKGKLALGGLAAGGVAGYMNGDPTQDALGAAYNESEPYDYNRKESGGVTTSGGSALEEYLKFAISQGGLGGGGGRYDTAADTMNAESARMNAETNRYQAFAQEAYQKAQVSLGEYENALKSGDLALAREKFQDSQVWNARAAEATDTMNNFRGIDSQTSAYKGQIDAFGASESAAVARGGLQARGAENMTGLAGMMGNLSQAQEELRFKIASTPRNAIAGLMMGRGQPGSGQNAYAPGNVLGFDPSMLQTALQNAMSMGQQVGNLPPPQFNLQQTMAGLQGAAAAAQSAMPVNRQVAPPSDPSASRIVGNRVNEYKSTFDRMVAGGAPGVALEGFKKSAAEAGYPVG